MHMNSQPNGRLKMERDQLIDEAGSLTRGTNHLETAIPGLHLARWEEPTPPTSYTMGPSVCLIAQGAKRVMLGDQAYDYDSARYLVTAVDLPVVAQIREASPTHPYLGIILAIDQQTVAELLVDGDLPGQAPRRTDRGIGVSDMTLPLLKAFNRLLQLQQTPEAVPILAPLIRKEIFYHLLVGPQGARMRQIAVSGTHGNQVARAIHWLKENFRLSLPIDTLADQVHMSRSSFYHHFRQITSLSPLQYRKHLRLQEARRLMVVEQVDAITAATAVGYESASQFNREYSRLFGKPPARDAAELRHPA